MIDEKHPDCHDTPARDSRPSFYYAQAGTQPPLVSIVTSYYNTNPL